MAKIDAALADRLASKIADNRSEPAWQESLWHEIDNWTDGVLDTKQTDIMFDMIVSRWNAAKAEGGAA